MDCVTSFGVESAPPVGVWGKPDQQGIVHVGRGKHSPGSAELTDAY